MKVTEKELQGLIPNLEGLPGIDPKTAFRINEAFRRIYEFFNLKLEEQRVSFDNKLTSLLQEINNKQRELNSLIGSLSQPLVGSSTPDFILQSVVSSYGPQSPNHFLAGPIPTFRQITIADLPPIVATQLNANGTILDIGNLTEGEYLRRLNDEIISGMPVGTTNIKEGILDDSEALLYLTPVNHRTKIRHILLFNNTAGTLTANLIARDGLNVEIFSDDFNLLSQEKIIITLNLVLPEGYKLNGFTSIEGAIEYSIFAIEEPI